VLLTESQRQNTETDRERQEETYEQKAPNKRRDMRGHDELRKVRGLFNLPP